MVPFQFMVNRLVAGKKMHTLNWRSNQMVLTKAALLQDHTAGSEQRKAIGKNVLQQINQLTVEASVVKHLQSSSTSAWSAPGTQSPGDLNSLVQKS
jgi:hypothetical protein